MSRNTDPTTETFVKRRLEELKEVPPRNPLRAAGGRARFLHEAAEIRHNISPATHARPSGWKFSIPRRKLAMNALFALILAASLLLGGGATIVAAQDDLPTQPLYQVKLWTEDTALALSSDPQEQAGLLMNMAQTRVEEMAALVETGITPPDEVRERLEKHLHQALVLAADMDEATREQTLLQLRDHLQTQDRIMEQLQTQASAGINPQLDRTRQTLRTNLHLVDEGIADPQAFRNEIKNQIQSSQDEEGDPELNQPGEPGWHQGGQPTGVPGAGNGNGNNTPGGSDPDHPQNGNGGNNHGNPSPGGQNPDKPKNNNCQGTNCNNGNGGGNK